MLKRFVTTRTFNLLKPLLQMMASKRRGAAAEESSAKKLCPDAAAVDQFIFKNPSCARVGFRVSDGAPTPQTETCVELALAPASASSCSVSKNKKNAASTVFYRAIISQLQTSSAFNSGQLLSCRSLVAKILKKSTQSEAEREEHALIERQARHVMDLDDVNVHVLQKAEIRLAKQTK